MSRGKEGQFCDAAVDKVWITRALVHIVVSYAVYEDATTPYETLKFVELLADCPFKL